MLRHLKKIVLCFSDKNIRKQATTLTHLSGVVIELHDTTINATLFRVCVVILSPINIAFLMTLHKEAESLIRLRFFLITTLYFLSCSQLGQSFSNLLMDIHLGMFTS